MDDRVGLFEALYTTRAMRRVTDQPVAEDVIRQMVDAAIRAPTGSNAQSWRWVVVTDPVVIAALGDLYAEAWRQLTETVYAGVDRSDPQASRVVTSAQWLADNFSSVPLVVLPFHRNDPSGASIYPAVWSLMLAGRALGIGTTLTTVLGMFKHDEVAALLDVPVDKGWRNAAAVTCGHPTGAWGIATRRPAHEVVFQDRWGDPPSWTIDEPLWGPAGGSPD
jgi:nitroreductase